MPTKTRKQRGGKQKGWSLEQLKVGFLKFRELYGHYPTAHEIDVFEFLPSSRSIQRRFGGLVELRKTLELKSSSDFRTGTHSSKRAKKINERAYKTEKKYMSILSVCLDQNLSVESIFSLMIEEHAQTFLYIALRVIFL